MPPNLASYYEMIMPIATFDILPGELMEALFAFEDDSYVDEESGYYDQYLELEYDSHNPIAVLGSAYFLVLYLVIVVPIKILLRLIRNCCCSRCKA